MTNHLTHTAWRVRVLLWTSSICFATSANAAPFLQAIFPLSCEPGKTVTVSLAGKQLEKANALVFSIPEVTAARDDAGRLMVSVAAGTPPQDCDVWCVADGELSNPRRFVVSTLLRVAETGKNHSTDTALAIPFPGAVDGRLEAAARLDWFQFEATGGQSVTLSCRSRSLDGSTQPVVVLFSPTGREIAHSTGRQQEPLLSRKLAETGTYQVRVSDRAYRTATDSFYRLELLAGPQIIAAWPDLIQRMAAPKPSLSLYGHELPNDSERSFRIAGSRSHLQRLVRDVPLPVDSLRPAWQTTTEPFSTFIPLRLAASVNAVAGSPRVRLVDQVVTSEDESATRPSTGLQPLPLPALLNGRFNIRNDVDRYAFHAKKGDTFHIDIYGARLGHLMDLDAVIMDETGKTLVTFPDAPAAKNLPAILTQPSLDVAGTWKAPSDGTFHLVLRDLYGSTLFGVDRTYVLSLRRTQPSFTVVITPPDAKTPMGYSIPKNGRTALRVSLLRRDEFNDAVRLRLSQSNQKAGLTLDETWIGPGESSTLAMLSVGPGFDIASPVNFLEFEAATESDDPLVKQARAISLLRTATAEGRFMNRLPVSISTELPMTVALSLANPQVKAGGTLTLTLRHTLKAGSLKAAAKIEFPTLPTGTKPPTAELQSTAESTSIGIVIPDKLSPGKYSLAALVAATVVSDPVEPQPVAKAKTAPPEQTLRVWSNSVSFRVIPKAKSDSAAPGK